LDWHQVCGSCHLSGQFHPFLSKHLPLRAFSTSHFNNSRLLFDLCFDVSNARTLLANPSLGNDGLLDYQRV
jgi:hypothetical protein